MSTDLQPANGQLAIRGRISPTGYQPPETFDDWLRDGEMLNQLEACIQWVRGDWSNAGEHKWGEKYAQALEDTGLDYSTLTNYAYVARQVAPQTRDPELSWSHHRAVASLDPPTQKVLLSEAKANDWTKGQLEKEAKARRDGTEVEEPKTCSECGRKLPA